MDDLNTRSSQENGGEDTQMAETYEPTASFRFAGVVLAAATIWFGYMVWQQPTAVRIAVLIGLIIITAGMLLHAFVRATFDGQTLVYRVPLRPTRRVDLNQIDTLELSGRRTKALVLIYYPREENGRIAVERIRTINFPPLQGQDELLELLGGDAEDDEFVAEK